MRRREMQAERGQPFKTSLYNPLGSLSSPSPRAACCLMRERRDATLIHAAVWLAVCLFRKACQAGQRWREGGCRSSDCCSRPVNECSGLQATRHGQSELFQDGPYVQSPSKSSKSSQSHMFHSWHKPGPCMLLQRQCYSADKTGNNGNCGSGAHPSLLPQGQVNHR